MKKSAFLVTLCAALAGCSNDGYMGDVPIESGGEIAFSMSVPDATRASGTAADAALLSNRFVVYAFNLDNAATEAANGSTDTKVFDMYNVHFASGYAGEALSGTKGWEYVGYTSKNGVQQSVKYWDFGCKYVFSAISCGDDVSVTKITDASTIAGTTVYEKGWLVSVPAGVGLGGLYASDRKEIVKSIKAPDTKYSFQTVDFTFYSLAAKIRFGFYETVPDYSVRIDRCYYGTDFASSTTTNLAVNGTFKGMNESGATNLVVTYDSSNRPLLSYNSENTATCRLFGANLMAQTAIGTSSASATYDQAGGEYTLILPYQSKQAAVPAGNELSLKLDYTLVPLNGSGAERKVLGATMVIPTEFTQWKHNCSYTYLIKISDTNMGLAE